MAAKKSKERRELYRIYTDGSYRKSSDYKPSAGSYVAIIFDGKGNERIIQRGAWNSTISRLELLAIIVALESIEEPSTVSVYSDSQYAVNSLSRWLPAWHKNGYVRITGEPVRNVDILIRLHDQIVKHNVSAYWVRGHSDDPLNERADALAQHITFSMRLGTYEGEIDGTENKNSF